MNLVLIEGFEDGSDDEGTGDRGYDRWSGGVQGREAGGCFAEGA